jgi:tRNA A37 threonylcarbamoyladenosine dehydratase
VSWSLRLGPYNLDIHSSSYPTPSTGRGVSKIRLIDFDYVTLSSLNRHATAGFQDVGTPKVKCIEKALKQISRWVEVDCRIELWRKDGDGERMLEGADWVVGEFLDLGGKNGF